MSNILEQAKQIEDKIIDLRRWFHQHPELSGEEYKTQKKIMKELDALGIPYQKAGNTSLIATIKGKQPGKTIALRADIDALPIVEASGVSYSSDTEGVMHACGHDAHTAMLLGAAMILAPKKDEIKGEIRLFFQEAEEIFGGGKHIIDAGGMEGVDAVFAMHGTHVLKTGEINIEPGYRLSGCDTIYVKFEGVSGHSSSPHLAKDTIHPASLFVVDLQSVVTKHCNALEPIVLSVGKFNAGTKANIISKYAELEVSMRYFDSKARDTAHKALIRHAVALGNAYDVKVDVRIEESTISLYNDEELTVLASESAVKVFGKENLQPTPKQMASEDMPYYFEHAKGVYAFIGYYNEELGAIHPPHHEEFKIDEAYLKYGTALHVQFALDFLGDERKSR